MSEPLRSFMVRLAVDPERLSAFIDDPDRAMADWGLSLEERELVRSGDQDRLFEALSRSARPAMLHPGAAHPAGAWPPGGPGPGAPGGFASVILVPVPSPYGAAVVPVAWAPAGAGPPPPGSGPAPANGGEPGV